MDTPEPVMRGGHRVYEVPDLESKSCFGCRWFDSEKTECTTDDFASVAAHCVASPIIFIEATPEAYTHYITQRIQKGLQS